LLIATLWLIARCRFSRVGEAVNLIKQASTVSTTWDTVAQAPWYPGPQLTPCRPTPGTPWIEPARQRPPRGDIIFLPGKFLEGSLGDEESRLTKQKSRPRRSTRKTSRRSTCGPTPQVTPQAAALLVPAGPSWSPCTRISDTVRSRQQLPERAHRSIIVRRFLKIVRWSEPVGALAPVAQSAELLFCKQRATGSSPVRSSIFYVLSLPLRPRIPVP
jgi:hypothetical protein